MKQKIVIIHGSTGSGKSDLAIKLAKQFNGFLISADSRQVYKGMDIGTNKDKGTWKNGHYLVDGIEEYMVDIVEPDQEFSLDDWLKRVKDILDKNKDRLPIIVGGTGLYTQALVQGFDLPGQNKKLRKKLEKKVEKKGLDWLLNKIKKIDPEIEQKIQIENSRRVIRAGEIVLSTKKPLERKALVSLVSPVSSVPPGNYNVLQIGIKTDRKELYEKINKRVDQMVESGLIDEVKNLKEHGLTEKDPSMTGIGYRQILAFLNNKIVQPLDYARGLREAVELIKRDSRRYAKRQMTWFKRDDTIQWIDSLEDAKLLVGYFLKG